MSKKRKEINFSFKEQDIVSIQCAKCLKQIEISCFIFDRSSDPMLESIYLNTHTLCNHLKGDYAK